MNIAGVHERGYFLPRLIASYDKPLPFRSGQIQFPAPESRRKRYMQIGLRDLFLCRPSCGSMLTIADRLAFDAVEGIILGEKRSRGEQDHHAAAKED